MSINGYVTVEDYGWVGDGVADDTVAVRAAIDSGKNVFIPKGTTRLTAPVICDNEGQTITGENSQTCLLVSGSTPFDFFRIAAAFVTIENVMYRPSNSGDIFCNVYAPFFTLRHTRALSAVNGQGSVLKFADHTPSSTFVPGAYTHVIDQNRFGYDGYTFNQTITVDTPTGGLQACKFRDNMVLGDKFIGYSYGGGNTYIGNLFQSATGTLATPAGDCIDLGATVSKDMIMGNYFERYANSVKVVNNDALGLDLNHYDQTGSGSSYTLLTGTAIGDMTSGGGLAALNDGQTSEQWGDCAYKPSSTAGWVGYNFGSAKAVTKIVAHPAITYGFDSTYNPPDVDQTFVVKSSDDGTNWTTRGTIGPFPDQTTPKELLAGTDYTAATAQYWRLDISNANGSSNPPVCGELEMYEG